jgi:NAD(P)-dependent dehydrogenase (short-subunit alcohol dehydrogenase family)
MVKVLVTGASGTVGSAILAGLLGQPGYAVVTAGRRTPASPGPSCQHVTVDFADPDATEDAARQLATAGFGAAVFAAGIDSRQGLPCADPDVFRRVMQVNCLAHLQLLRHLAGDRDSRPEPFPVVAVSSDVLCAAQPATAVYAASKAALEEAIRHGAQDVPLRVLLMRLPDIGVTMAETGEAGITPRQDRQPPPAAREAAATTVRFLASPGTPRGVQVWP